MAWSGDTNAKSRQSLGFLTVTEDEQDGIFGGYLSLNLVGRPLEFHCTAPIKPNRAQEILYGPTLFPYLYGEQIGQTLLKKITHPPLVVLTDRPAVVAVREFIDIPVALVLQPEKSKASDTSDLGEFDPQSDDPVSTSPAETKHWRLDAAHPHQELLREFHLGHHRMAVSSTSESDQETIAQRLSQVGTLFDLLEPFTRIRGAIAEARCGGR